MSDVRDLSGEDVAFRIGEPLGFLNLCGNLADDAFRDGVAAIFEVSLPQTPGTYQRDGERLAYWLGPDEWLLAMPHGEQAKKEGDLRARLTGHYSVVDVSGSHVRFLLAGREARTVLQQASPYDFHATVFAPGRCVQTVFAKATALVVATGADQFELVVRASYADYVGRWMTATVARTSS